MFVNLWSRRVTIVSVVSNISNVLQWMEVLQVPTTSINEHEPATVAQSEEEQITELRRIVERGATRLVAEDGHLIELPHTVQALLLKMLKSLQAGKAVSVIAE